MPLMPPATAPRAISKAKSHVTANDEEIIEKSRYVTRTAHTPYTAPLKSPLPPRMKSMPPRAIARILNTWLTGL